MVWKIQNSFFTEYLPATAFGWCQYNTYRPSAWTNFDTCNFQGSKVSLMKEKQNVLNKKYDYFTFLGSSPSVESAWFSWRNMWFCTKRVIGIIKSPWGSPIVKIICKWAQFYQENIAAVTGIENYFTNDNCRAHDSIYSWYTGIQVCENPIGAIILRVYIHTIWKTFVKTLSI